MPRDQTGRAPVVREGRTYTLTVVAAEFSEGHFNVRGSNTEPDLRWNVEATSQRLMEEKRDESSRSSGRSECATIVVDVRA